MARVGKIDFGDLEGDLEQVVKETTLALHGKLKLYEAASRGGIGTPVDTGVLIGNWQMAMDNPRQVAFSTTRCMQNRSSPGKMCRHPGKRQKAATSAQGRAQSRTTTNQSLKR